MKLKNLLAAVFVFCLLAGCKKDNNTTVTATLITKWNLVTDYTANHIGQTNTYAGIAGDYFDFRSNGKCYIKEGAQYDTLSYIITSDTTIAIQPFGFNNAAYYSDQAAPFNSACRYHHQFRAISTRRSRLPASKTVEIKGVKV